MRSEKSEVGTPLPLTPDPSPPIRVIVADDSPFICRLLTQYLESEPAVRVIKTAGNGKEAVRLVKSCHPDVITLDLNMPLLSGLDALRCIMAECPVPTVLISGVSKEAARMTGTGLSLGAVDFIFKYSSEAAVPPDILRREIVAKVRAAAQIKVIRNIPSLKTQDRECRPLRIRPFGFQGTAGFEFSQVAVIGASAGGPLALKELLSCLGKSEKFRAEPFPLVIVQHIPGNFTRILAEQLNRVFPFPVREAKEGELLKPGTVLIAPGDRHLTIASQGRICLSTAPEINGYRPSIDAAMQSATHTFGSHVTGVILSGMGNDGVQGLSAIRNNYGNTYAQSAETCVAASMPVSAIRKGIVKRTGPPARIAQWLIEGFGVRGTR